MPTDGWRALAALTVLALYYAAGKSLLSRVSPRVAAALWCSGSQSFSAKRLTVELVLLAAGHWIAIGAAMTIYAFPLRVDVARGSALDYLDGAVLGVGEFGLASIVCRAMMEVISAVDHRETWTADAWRALASGGWIRHYVVPATSFPTTTTLLGLLQVTAEEIVFRGILPACFGNGIAAICFSCLCFMAIQSFRMPGWKSAAFAMAGAFVIGMTHGALRASGCALGPLIAAHSAVFFLGMGVSPWRREKRR